MEKKKKTASKFSREKLPNNIFSKHFLPPKSDVELQKAYEIINQELKSEIKKQKLIKQTEATVSQNNIIAAMFEEFAFDFFPVTKEKQKYGLKLFSYFFYDWLDNITKLVAVEFFCKILPYPYTALLDKDEATKRLKFADSNKPILLLGETGTGKELYAKIFHYLSPRRKEKFFTINCTAIPGSLMESELFGYEKGAHDKAYESKKGLLESVGKGTLFLDEIGDMPINLQVRLLRVLETGDFYSISGYNQPPKNFEGRVISSTNKDIEKEIFEGKFRKDLYYRLNIFKYEPPPLRDQSKEEKELIIVNKLLCAVTERLDYENKKYEELYKTEKYDTLHRIGPGFAIADDPINLKQSAYKFISLNAFEILKNYSYPGNFRELDNILEQLIHMCDITHDFQLRKIEVKHLPLEVLQSSVQAEPETPSDSWLNLSYKELIERLNDLHKKKVESTLEETSGNVRAAAKILGIPDHKLRNSLIKDLGINVKEFKKGKA